MSDQELKPFLEHVAELRRRILWVLAVLVVSMIGGFLATTPFIDYLKTVDPAKNIEWNVFSPWDAIRVYMQFAFVIGLAVTFPFALYQIWAFMKPGLKEEEQKAALKYIPGALLLFVIGLLFAYFVVFPLAFHFTSGVARSLQLTETYGITEYFTFMFHILLPISLLFELPVVVMFLTRIRLLNPKRLQKMRRYAYLLLVIVGTTITPPDFISDILVIIPMIVLYEFSVALSAVVYRKQLAREAFEE